MKELKRKLKRKPRNEDAKLMVEDCERFFCSEWFEVLSSTDGKALLNRLKEEDTK